MLAARVAGGSVMPSTQSLEKMLHELLARQITVKKLASPPPASELTWVGDCLGDGGVLVAVLASDIAFAARAGACLAMIPTGIADESIKKKDLHPSLIENFFEIINIVSALINQTSEVHVRLGTLVPSTKADAAVASAIKTSKTRLDCEVTIGGYGVGKFSMIMV